MYLFKNVQSADLTSADLRKSCQLNLRSDPYRIYSKDTLPYLESDTLPLKS